MTKDELIEKYVKKCNNAKLKKDKMRKNFYRNNNYLDKLEHIAYAREFYLTEEMVKDLKQMN